MAIETTPQPAAAPRPSAVPRRQAQARRIRVSVRKVSPWSVLKFSLLFYFCLMLIVVFGLGILWAFLDAWGVLGSIEELLSGVGFGEGAFEFEMFALFRTLFLIGFISVVVGAALTTFVAFLYNLISDLVGGIDVTLVERR